MTVLPGVTPRQYAQLGSAAGELVDEPARSPAGTADATGANPEYETGTRNYRRPMGRSSKRFQGLAGRSN